MAGYPVLLTQDGEAGVRAGVGRMGCGGRMGGGE
jgi:hypothetical protein